tara:strand:+ start:609 stop:2423 length:1815 start_codon:yes stop_codon:yes gene_type:complete
MSNPRLAYLFSRYPIVSQTFCDNEILGLEEAGWDVVVASLNPPLDDFRHARLDALKAPVLYPPPPNVLKLLEEEARAEGTWPQELIDQHEQAFGADTKPDQRCRNALPLVSQLRREGIDHVHLHFANRATHSALFLKAMSGIPYSFTPQAKDFLVDIEPKLLEELCREAEFVVAPCDYAQKKLAEMCPDSADKIVRIYNGIDPSGYRQAQPKAGPDVVRIASCGRLIEFKGFHHLIAAVGEARSNGVRVEFELLGDGPWRERLENQTDELGLRDRVTFRGTVGLDEMKSTFERIDAFVLACIFDQEGASDMFPTVITEAMLSGLAVVSTPIAGVPEMVMEGKTGMLVEPGDEKALADALCRFANEPDLAINMGKAGRERAVEVFSRQTTLAQLQDRLKEAKARSSAPSPPAVAAFFELKDGDGDRFNVERAAMAEMSGSLWVAAGLASPNELKAIGDLEALNWLPDGMVLEMEWRSHNAERTRLVELRSELGTSVDGETFFSAARRALWWAEDLRRRGGAKLLFAGDTTECLVVWLTSRITGIPFVAALERESAFSKNLRTRIFEAANAIALQNQEDPLLRSARRAKPDARISALRNWLQSVSG